ncbi:hypothetical protein J6E39_03655 [bacterium]|nr:hypothetical protein [bacterium]
MKKYGFGIIELLLGLLIVSIMVVTFFPLLKSVNSSFTTESSVQNVQQEIDKKVSEIEHLKKLQNEYQYNE